MQPLLLTKTFPHNSHMLIREDEEQDMHNILLRAFDQIKDARSRSNEVSLEANEARLKNDLIRYRELRTKAGSLGVEPGRIVKETIATLKRCFSDEAFKKIDDYVTRLTGKVRASRMDTWVDVPESCEAAVEPEMEQAPAANHDEGEVRRVRHLRL